jgi:glycosyl hydrolase family 35
MRARALAALAVALVAGCLASPAHAAGRHTHTIAYDRYSFSLDGQRVWLWSAEFHYYRLPNPDLWRDQLEKLKAAGFNAVSLYFSWAYHSPAPGVFDFSGVRDLDRLLDIADEVGLYVLARPGPYINAELDSGGYPAWLTTQAGRARTAADDYQAAWEEWFAAVNRIIARHQFTDGRGPVVLFQIENEYDGSDAAYMEELKAAARRDAITVPLFHNDKGRNPAVVGRSGSAGALRDRHLSRRLRLQPHVVPRPDGLPLPARRDLVQSAAPGRRQPAVLLGRVPGRRLRPLGRARLRPLPGAHRADVRADVLRQQHREPVHGAEPLHDLRRDQLGLAGRPQRRLHLLRLRRRVQRAASADREGPGPQAAGLHGGDGRGPVEGR